MDTDESSLLLIQLQELQNSLHPVPPSDYKPNFLAQLVLSTLLLALCIFYIASSIYDARRSGRAFTIARVQQLATGRIIVLNSLFLLVFFIGCNAVCAVALRWKLYGIYYEGRSQTDLVVIQIAGYSPLVLCGWSYCLGNAAGMMQLRRRDVGGPTRLAVIAYNIVFFGFPIVWFGVSIPLTIISNIKTNNTIAAAQHALDLLNSLVTEDLPAGVDPMSVLSEVQTLAPLIDSKGSDANLYIHSVTIMAGVVAALTVVALIMTLSFVRFLLLQSKWDAQKRLKQQQAEIKTEVFKEETRKGENSKQRDKAARFKLSSSASGGQRQLQSPSSGTGNYALQRLAKDISVSLPVVLLVAAYLVIMTVLAVSHLEDTDDFTWAQVSLDGVSWTSPLLVVGVTAHILNMWLFPSQSKTSQSNIEAQGRSRSMSKGRINVRAVDEEPAALAFASGFDKSPRALTASGQVITFEIVTATKIDESEEAIELPSRVRYAL